MRNIGYPSETHIKTKSRENPFAYNLFLCDLKHITAVLCMKFRNGWTNETDVMGKRDSAIFELTMNSGRTTSE